MYASYCDKKSVTSDIRTSRTWDIHEQYIRRAVLPPPLDTSSVSEMVETRIYVCRVIYCMFVKKTLTVDWQAGRIQDARVSPPATRPEAFRPACPHQYATQPLPLMQLPFYATGCVQNIRHRLTYTQIAIWFPARFK